MNAVIGAKEKMNMAMEKFEAAKDKLEETREKLSRYNFKRLKAIVTFFTILNFALVAAALAMSIIALVKSCKASKRVAKCENYCDCDDDYDDDYDFTLEDNEIPSPTIKHDDENEELSF